MLYILCACVVMHAISTMTELWMFLKMPTFPIPCFLLLTFASVYVYVHVEVFCLLKVSYELKDTVRDIQAKLHLHFKLVPTKS